MANLAKKRGSATRADKATCIQCWFKFWAWRRSLSPLLIRVSLPLSIQFPSHSSTTLPQENKVIDIVEADLLRRKTEKIKKKLDIEIRRRFLAF